MDSFDKCIRNSIRNIFIPVISLIYGLAIRRCEKVGLYNELHTVSKRPFDSMLQCSL